MSFFVHVLTNEKPEFMAQFVHSSRTGAFVANNRFIFRNDAIMMNMKGYHLTHFYSISHGVVNS